MSSRNRFRDWRLLLLALAALALIPVFARPSVPASEPVLKYLFAVDITQSMNVRDYAFGDQPIDRLSFVKAALIQAAHELPCGSLVGLGVFTGWQTEILFDPIEVCHHRREIDEAIRYIDWRMTWIPQSNVALGLKDALAKLGPRNESASLVFLTDGDEAPDYGNSSVTRGTATPAQAARGVIIGVGDLRPSAVPLLNQYGRATGYFQRGREPYLSSLKQDYLHKLGRRTGMDYQRLENGAQLMEVLRSERYADMRPARRELAWVFGGAALVLVAVVYLAAPISRLASSASLRDADRSSAVRQA